MKLKKIFGEVLLTLFIISGTSATFALLTNLKVDNGNTLTHTLWNNLVDHSVPTGAVMSFSLETCPVGWSEYTALQGKFIRGADTGANNDPDFATRTGGTGARKIGSTQDGQFQSHNHVHRRSWTGGSSDVRTAEHTTAATLGGSPSYTNTTGGSETRPKNVYLLYCIKN